VSDPDAELTELFRDEATTRLDQMDAALVAIEAGDAGSEVVGSLFRNAHTIKGAASMLGMDDIRTLAHAAEDVLAVVRDTGVFPPELAAPLMRATSTLRAQVAGGAVSAAALIDELAACRASLTVAAPPAGSQAQFAVGPTAAVDPPAAAASLSPAAASPSLTVAVPPPAATAPALAAAVPAPAARPALATAGPGQVDAIPPPLAGPSRAAIPPPAAQPGAGQVPRAGGGRSLRVPAEKIDHLLDLVGEVMQDQRRLAHSLGNQADLPPGVADQLSAGERVLDELKDSAVGMRTLPVGAITGPLPRAIRDIARGEGKDVEFAVTGADTELDRVILESLSEALTHLLRNAVSHGIEPPAERERAGKPRRGRIELRAVPRGNLVEIVVADDGRGVSPEVVEEARRAGSLADVLAREGFSTAAEVTDLAGRGVGLDAVKAYVQSLGGSFVVRSEPGQGMEVILLLPLALALLEVLLLQRGEAVYGVPLAGVEEVMRVDQTLTLQGRPSVTVRGQPFPLADIARLLGADAPPLPLAAPAIVITAGGNRVVLACDSLLGGEEVAVKPLGPLLAGAEGYLGAAILGDGRIALLLEPARLTRGVLAATPVEHKAAPTAPPKILVVEDSFTVRELQRSILEAAGYPVVTARHGREGLERLAAQHDIAMVITDLEMPELNGLELTRACRADPALSSLPVVIVTSLSSDEDRQRGIEAGADAYMVKQTFDQQTLLATVHRLVGR
jgi:two-component system chemotaxis sensor kinase CheA